MADQNLPREPETGHEDNAPQSAEYQRGRLEGMMEALRLTHTPEQLAEMGIV